MTIKVTEAQRGFQYLNDDGTFNVAGLELMQRITQAIIELQGEAGSNANGNYVRANIGGVKLQICWQRSVSGTNPRTWTFPAAFAEAPACFATSVTVNSGWTTVQSVTTTSADFRSWQPGTPDALSGAFHNQFAIGTWA